MGPLPVEPLCCAASWGGDSSRARSRSNAMDRPPKGLPLYLPRDYRFTIIIFDFAVEPLRSYAALKERKGDLIGKQARRAADRVRQVRALGHGPHHSAMRLI